VSPAAAAPFPRFRVLDVFLTGARPADAVGAIVARASDRSAPGASLYNIGMALPIATCVQLSISLLYIIFGKWHASPAPGPEEK